MIHDIIETLREGRLLEFEYVDDKYAVSSKAHRDTRMKQLAAKDTEIEALDKENIVMRQQMEKLIDERDALMKVREAADVLAEAVVLVPGFMSVVSNVIQDVWQRYGVKDSGLPFNPDEVAGNVEDAAKAYKDVRDGNS